MSNEDQISAFLKTIPKDCKNGDLLIAKGIIEGDRSRFPTLVGNVIPMLTPTSSLGSGARKFPSARLQTLQPACSLVAVLASAVELDAPGLQLGSFALKAAR